MAESFFSIFSAKEDGTIGFGAGRVVLKKPSVPGAWAIASRLGFLSAIVWFQDLESMV